MGLTAGADLGGGGEGLRAAAQVIEALAGACGSTAMVTLMHYAATAVIEAYGPEKVRRQVASGEHLSTLAFSEVGSRSHFWATQSPATVIDGHVRLDAPEELGHGGRPGRQLRLVEPPRRPPRAR